jgi:hypothetical protein|tara:strand:+ start:3024 stop:3257 length:234 start_codon:yes stop_codon:yes gene_type:complete
MIISEDEVQAVMKKLYQIIDHDFIIVNGLTATQTALISIAINLSDVFENSKTTEEILQHALAELEKDRYVIKGNKLN